MARSVRSITVNFSAGTSKFLSDVDQAKAKVREFGSSSAGSMVKAGAAIRVLEGDWTRNTRAVERFLSESLKLGPALNAIFPAVGAIAFFALMTEGAKKVYEFFKNAELAPERINGAFRSLNAGVRLTNDELRVANDRLTNDIAKLEGRHQNTLKLALDEAKVAADRLAQSLDRDLASLDKLLREESAGSAFENFFKESLGSAGTRDIALELGGQTGFGGFRGKIAGIQDPKRLQAAFEDEIRVFKNALVDAQDFEANRTKPGGRSAIFGLDNSTIFGDATARIEALKGGLAQLQEQFGGIGLTTANAVLTQRKESLEASRENRLEDKPFEDRMKLLSASIDGVKAKLQAIGQPEAAQVIAKAFGEAQKAIAETDKALERHNKTLTDAQKEQIRAAELAIAAAEAEADWQTKFASATTSIDERVRSQELLTAAIGKGYEATRAANAEARLMQELGAHFNDPEWMAEHQDQVSRLRVGFGSEFDAQHGEQSTQATQKLKEEIELEKALAAAQRDGAQAVREATLAVKLRQKALAGATKEQIEAEIELFNAQRANAAAGDVAKIQERIAATEQLTAAILGGAEAERRAALESKYSEMQRAGATPEAISTEKQADQAEHQQKLTAEAAKTGLEYRNQIETLDQEIAALERIRADQGDTLAIELSLRDLENQRLRALVQQSLQLRGMRDGVRAFFLEMQQDAKSAAAIIYESLNSALDRTSANLAKMLTEKKPKSGWGQVWGKEFQSIGQEALQSSIKGLAQKGLGELGKKLGFTAKPDGSSPDKAFWVRMAGAKAAVGGSLDPKRIDILRGNGGLLGTGQVPQLGGGRDGDVAGGPDGSADDPFFVVQKGLGGRGGRPSGGANFLTMTGSAVTASAITGGLGQLASSLGHFGGGRAEGGMVSPWEAYIVGEEGPEILTRASGRITSYAEAARTFGGGGTVIHNHIDARGADIGAMNRIKRGMEMTHRSSVATAVQATHERARRVPGGSR